MFSPETWLPLLPSYKLYSVAAPPTDMFQHLSFIQHLTTALTKQFIAILEVYHLLKSLFNQYYGECWIYFCRYIMYQCTMGKSFDLPYLWKFLKICNVTINFFLHDIKVLLYDILNDIKCYETKKCSTLDLPCISSCQAATAVNALPALLLSSKYKWPVYFVSWNLIPYFQQVWVKPSKLQHNTLLMIA